MPNIIVPKERVYAITMAKDGRLVRNPIEFKSDKSKIEHKMKSNLESEFRRAKRNKNIT